MCPLAAAVPQNSQESGVRERWRKHLLYPWRPFLPLPRPEVGRCNQNSRLIRRFGSMSLILDRTGTRNRNPTQSKERSGFAPRPIAAPRCGRHPLGLPLATHPKGGANFPRGTAVQSLAPTVECPVHFWALARLATSVASVRTGDFRNAMALFPSRAARSQGRPRAFQGKADCSRGVPKPAGLLPDPPAMYATRL
jgi:hypothetical protein